MMSLGRDIMEGMRNVDTWAYEDGVVLGSHLAVPPNNPGALAPCPPIYTGV